MQKASSVNVFDYVQRKEGPSSNLKFDFKQQYIDTFNQGPKGLTGVAESIAELEHWMGSQLHNMNESKGLCQTTSALAPAIALDYNKEKIWYGLLTHQIALDLPGKMVVPGFDSFDVYLGRFTFTVTPILDPGQEGSALCKKWGPSATTESGSTSNTVEESLGANVGFFGETLTAGLSAGYSMSNTVTTTIEDCVITTSSKSGTNMSWAFDFTEMHGSTASSNFEYTLQAIWRYEPTPRDNPTLSNVQFKVDVTWTPQVRNIRLDRIFNAEPATQSFNLAFDDLPQTFLN